MTTALPRRLQQLFGADFDEVDEAALSVLVGHSEGDDLEVKAQAYGRSDSNKRELCADVTALANGRGGLLLIGASETSDGIDALTPIKLDGEELWIRQVLASGVAPPVHVQTRSIPSATGEGVGYLGIVVGASADAPHAVLTNDDFRYVIRDGPGKRSMREPEVADQHRRRVVAATTRLERLAEVRAAIEAHTSASKNNTWLSLCAVPDMPGRFSISTQTRNETTAWIQTIPEVLPIPNTLSSLSGAHTTTGFRRIVLGDVEMANTGAPAYAVAELHSDGAVAVAFHIGGRVGRIEGEDASNVPVTDILVPFYLIAALVVAGLWAERTGSSGQINIASYISSETPAVLVEERRFMSRLHGTRSMVGSTEVATHTFNLRDLTSPGPDVVTAGSLIANDLFNSFGAGQCWQLAPSGAIRQNFVDRQHMSLVEEWAGLHGVLLSEETF